MTQQVRIISNRQNTTEYYHTTECRKYPEDGRDIPRKAAEDRGLNHCTFCSGDYEPHAGDDPMRYINAVMGND